jgi:hypothetical protein
LFIVSFFAFSLKIEDHNWNVLWNYFNTEVFKTLLLSIAIPLVVFIWRSYEKKRDKQFEIEEKKIEIEENQRKERLAKIIEEHKVKRIDAIEKTFDQWNQINYLISEVRFVKLIESDISNVQSKIASQSIAFSKLIYIWSSRFPILPNIASYLFVSYTNVLYWSAWGIAYSLRNTIDQLFSIQISEQQYDKKDIKKCRDLQEALGIFQRGIVSISFLHLSYVLKYTDQLLGDIETHVEDEQIQNELINQIRSEIETYLTKILNKENEKDDIYKYRLNYKKYYINEQKEKKYEENKSKEFVPIPISLLWDRFEKKIKKNIVSIDIILKEMSENADSTKSKMISQIDKKISNLTKQQINKNIDNLIKELLYLKIYEFLLFIDKFRIGEILPPSENKNLSMKDEDSVELRKSFQSINKKIISNISDKLYYIQEDKDKIDKIISGEMSSGLEYKSFMHLFKITITDTNLMNIVADDVVEYVKLAGREIRFARILSHQDDLTPVS